MNTFFKQAQDFVDREVSLEFEVVKESIQDLPDLYCFTYQSRKFLKTGNHMDIDIGPGYNFIHKISNRLYSYGSGTSFDDALKDLRKKLEQWKELKRIIPEFEAQKRYDLKLSKVIKKQILIETLLKFGMSYIIPEVVGGSIFRIGKIYKKNLLSEKLDDAPIVFHGINQEKLPELLIELTKNNSGEFEILEHTEKNYANYANKATELDLESIW